MPYYINQILSEGMLTLRYQGEVVLIERLQALERVLRMCQDYCFTKILIDLRGQISYTYSIDMANFSKILTDAGLPQPLKVAYVCSSCDPVHDKGCEVNRQLRVDCNVFADTATASRWLTEA